MQVLTIVADRASLLRYLMNEVSHTFDRYRQVVVRMGVELH